MRTDTIKGRYDVQTEPIRGFTSPNYTQTPNDLFDTLLPEMGLAELKVVMVIIRNTFGYHRDEVKLSIRDLARATGMTAKSTMSGAEQAEGHGLIERSQDGKKTTIWRAIVSVIPSNTARNTKYHSKVIPTTPQSRVKESKESNKDGADAPNATWKIGDEELPMDWQVGLGKEVTTLSEEELFKKQARDAANLIEQGCAGGGELAYAFMVTRKLIIAPSKAKGQRKAAKEMLEAKVKAKHVIESTKQLMEARDKNGNRLTCVDLFSISKIAIGIANTPTIGDPDYVRPEHKPVQEKVGKFVPPPARLRKPGSVSG